MITSDKQYRAARDKLEMLAASHTAPSKVGIAEVIANAARLQITELADELQTEILKYERIRAMQPEEGAIQPID